MQRSTLDEKAIFWIYYKLSNLFRINYCIAWNFQGRNFHKLMKGTILVEKTFTDCSLLPCQRTPHPQISWRKLLHLAIKLWNSQKFSPSKVCYTVHSCHTFTWKVTNLAVVGCWFSCVGVAASLGPWAEAAADRWNEKETISTTSWKASPEKSGKWAKILRQNYNQGSPTAFLQCLYNS